MKSTAKILWLLVLLIPTLLKAQGNRYSDMGVDNDPAHDARYPSVCYNSTDNQYLVIWSGNDGVFEYEIHGQLVDANGAEVGSDFQITNYDNSTSSSNDAGNVHACDCAYNPVTNEYMVVSYGVDRRAIFGSIGSGEYEVFGQRVSAAGARIGSMFRISNLGIDANTSNDTYEPKIAYNSIDNEFFVIWRGDNEDFGSLDDNEYEIWGQRISATGTQLPSTTDVRLSDMGPDGDDTYDANNPSIAYNSTDNEYMVIWRGDEDQALGFASGEDEIWGQRVSAAGAEIGSDIRLTTFNGTGNAWDAWDNDITYNSNNNTYMITFEGILSTDREIWIQGIDASGAVTIAMRQISDMGAGNVGQGWDPNIAYNPLCDEYLISWMGDEFVDGRYEIFGEIVDASGITVSADDFQIGNLGPAGDAAYDSWSPIVAANTTDGGFFVIWEGEHNVNTVDQAPEAFGDTVGCVNLVLPIELLSFTTECNEGLPTLTWITSSEINNDYFTIERSEDAINFTPVGFVQGAGNSNANISYTWIDDNPINGTAYYRLKQTDFDGAYEYHGIKTSECGVFDNLTIYPNPFTNSINIQLNEMVNYPYTIEIIDNIGRVVYSDIIINHTPTLNLGKDLAKGSYFIKVFNETTQLLEKIVKY